MGFFGPTSGNEKFLRESEIFETERANFAKKCSNSSKKSVRSTNWTKVDLGRPYLSNLGDLEWPQATLGHLKLSAVQSPYHNGNLESCLVAVIASVIPVIL